MILTISLSVAFVVGNLYLIFKEDSKVHRSQWLNQWDQVEVDDVIETFSTAGVITPAEEYPIYFDRHMGSFQKFLVSKGEKVFPSSPLFEYSSSEIDEKRTELETEKTKIQNEIQLIEAHIRKVEDLRYSSKKKKENETEDSTTVTLDNEILNQELEKKKLDEELKRYDRLLADLDTKKNNLKVTSMYEGYVKEINQQLENPILTIRSATPAVQGSFTGKQLKKVSEGMKAEVKLPSVKEILDGSIQHVETYPEKEPAVKRKSLYPFSIQLSQIEDLEEEITPGTKAKVKIITDEALNALAIPHTSIFHEGKKSYLLLLNKAGKIEKREIKTGLLVDGLQEIKKGVKKGDTFILNPTDIRLKNTTFITPIDLSLLDKKTIKEMRKKEIAKYLLMGFL